MTRKSTRGFLFILIAIVSTAFAACSTQVVAQEDTDSGYRFDMTMEAPGRDTVDFSGAVLNGDHSLAGVIGGITTRTVMTGGRLYSLNPAIKTAREVENPATPAADEDGWVVWLTEPGRINPLTFRSAAGVGTSFDGEVTLGDTEDIEVVFDNGRLVSISFGIPRQDGSVVYTWSNYEEDEDISPADFSIPDDYSVSEL